MFALLAVVGVLLFVLDLICLVHVITHPTGYRNGTQLIWVLMLLFTAPIGALLYLFLARGGPSEPVPGFHERTELIRKAMENPRSVFGEGNE